MGNLTNELIDYRKRFEQELLDDILFYWMKYGVEEKGNGFYGAVDLNGTPVPGAKKSCVLNARILWTFSAAAVIYKNSSFAQIADKAFRVLQENFSDAVHGGYFMELNSDNAVASDIKHTYAQAFVIYSLNKYYEFSKSEKVLNIIKSLFDLLEERAKDKHNSGYLEAFTRDWKLYAENRMADNNEPKSMNTHLHVMEAYASLYKVWKDDQVKIRLTELMTLFIENIIRHDGHLGIFFDEKFIESEASKGICSFGHDIEASWLLWEAAEILGNDEIINKMKLLSIKMADAVERVGLDKDGGLFLESTRFGSHLRTNKHWWLQAETLVGFMNAFELTRDVRYWGIVKLAWNFIDHHVIDHERGEWYTKVNRLGVPFLIEPEDDPSPYYRNDWKIDPWKCPYHNGRAMMELVHRINRILNNGAA
ncbi:MAG: N-acyl-D-glucosamine 2-epimerase [Calditrichaeota bacterium]|nr:MAG: N-acyl-D-glucosamine 2-epimerase [Calditrichota bacterium]